MTILLSQTDITGHIRASTPCTAFPPPPSNVLQNGRCQTICRTELPHPRTHSFSPLAALVVEECNVWTGGGAVDSTAEDISQEKGYM